jgi:hypothetical protein
MKPNPIRIVLLILCFMSTTYCSASIHYWIDPVNGSDENTGISMLVPWKTIKHALDIIDTSYSSREQTTENAIIHLASGAYNKDSGESFPIIMENYIELVGSSPEKVILDASGTANSVIYAEKTRNWSLQSLTIMGGMGTLIDEEHFGGGVYMKDSSQSTIKNCIIKNNASDRGGGCYVEGKGIEMYDCIIKENNSRFGAGFYFYKSTPILYNCLISGNNASEEGGGVYCNTDAFAANPNLFGCSIVSNTAKSSGGFLAYSGYISGCIIWNNGNLPFVYISDYWGSVTDSLIEGGFEFGKRIIDADPVFVFGPLGDYYLSQKNTGQIKDSPCVDTGLVFPEAMTDSKTTRTDGIFDNNKKGDMGYHYQPHIMFNLHPCPKFDFSVGENFKLLLNLDKVAPQRSIDLYFIMIDPDGRIYSGLSWKEELAPTAKNIHLPEFLNLDDAVILDGDLPFSNPPISISGKYTFAIAATLPETSDFISNIITTEINLK